ncbi:MAG TPA: hypothetical protein VHO73_08670, partial [Methylomirabilota bacterium]|nr:hypothetical protein [Methylomirabilota bacterium]
MSRSRPVVAASVLVGVTLLATGGSAGPDKIAFPAGWEKYVLYSTVDRYDNKQYRELYASTQEA